MKVNYLTSELLESLVKCSSLSMALEYATTEAKHVQNQLVSAEFDMSISNYMLQRKADLFAENGFADQWQFTLDLDKIITALNGTWLDFDEQPSYYNKLKQLVFEIRNNLLSKVETSESLIRVSSVYQEIKLALKLRKEPVIDCRYNIYIEKFVIRFNDNIPNNISMKERVKIINANVRAINEGVGKDVWIISYGVDTKNIKILIHDDAFQHKELQKIANLLKLPF